MSHNQLVRSLQGLCHLGMLGGLFYVFRSHQYHYLIISLITYWIIGVLGINIGMHRLLAHRSFKTYTWLEKLLCVISVLTTVGSPLAWVAVHRQHHRHCEKTDDPHSPYLLGKFKAWVGLWNKVRLDIRLVKDIRKDSFQRTLHSFYFLILVAWCSILFIIDPWLVIFVYAIPACLCLHSTSAIIVIAHKHGYKSYDLKQDESRNSWIANLITLGEGWHNNHHAKPGAWTNWERWWEWDLPACIIWCIRRRPR